jgi:DNA-binding MarR family transcriptional regulator
MDVVPSLGDAAESDGEKCAIGERELIDWAMRLRASIVSLARQMRRDATGVFTPTQLAVLGSIHRNGPITVGELAALERLSAPTISKVITALECEGVVKRRNDHQDRRVRQVEITEQGAKEIHQHLSDVQAEFTTRITALPPEQRAALASAVSLLEALDLEARGQGLSVESSDPADLVRGMSSRAGRGVGDGASVQPGSAERAAR